MRTQQAFSLCRYAKCYLRLALPLILLAAVTLLLAYLDARARDPVGANYYYPALLEYIIASLSIAFSGALLIDLYNKQK